MIDDDLEYFRARERQERAAAKAAASASARRAHQDLALHYSTRIMWIVGTRIAA
ncbi:MAG: hypothetical protein ABIO43_07885 [Sphingomicrobium sp.]